MSIYFADDSKPRVTIEDWFKNYHQYGTEYNELSQLGFSTRQTSAEIRNASMIETHCNKELVRELLSDRHKEIEEWKDLIVDCTRDVNNELHRLKYEKDLCCRDLQNLNLKFTVVNECNTLRSDRKKPDMCLDPVEAELEKEYRLLEAVKKNLSDKCEEAFARCTKIVELLGILQIDVEQKEEACKIEKSTLDLADNVASVCRKPEMSRFIKKFVALRNVTEFSYSSYESWLENCKFLESKTSTELQTCIKLREEMCQSRQNAFTEILAQFDLTNFAFRKRIFEVRYVVDELAWQKQMLQQEQERLSDEIDKLKEKLNAETDSLKLFESQNRNRIYRVNIELCQDKCTDNLETQVLGAKERVDRLNNQLNSTMKTYNLLDQQVISLNEEINNKTCALTIDVRCLEIRNESASHTST